MIKKATGFYETFDRKDGTKTTTYLRRLRARHHPEADRRGHGRPGHPGPDGVRIPVGCAAFCFYYFDCGNVAGPHGRASAVATGVSRVAPGQGGHRLPGGRGPGGDRFQQRIPGGQPRRAFRRFFVNNSIFAMTGGQMAPTTLPGQKTTTTPFGRDVAKTGYPLHDVRGVRPAGGAGLHRARLRRRHQAHHAGQEGGAQGTGDPEGRKGIRVRGVPLPLPHQLEDGRHQVGGVRHQRDGEGVPAGLLPGPQRRAGPEAPCRSSRRRSKDLMGDDRRMA